MKNFLICMLTAAVLVACSSGSSPLSSKKPLEAFADVAKMYTGVSVGKLNTNRASDKDVKQAQKANDACAGVRFDLSIVKQSFAYRRTIVWV